MRCKNVTSIWKFQFTRRTCDALHGASRRSQREKNRWTVRIYFDMGLWCSYACKRQPTEHILTSSVYSDLPMPSSQLKRFNIPLIKLFFSPFCRFLPSFACTTSLQTRIRIYICLWSDALNALHREQTCFSPHRPAICKPFFFCRRVVRRMRCALAECSLVLFG